MEMVSAINEKMNQKPADKYDKEKVIRFLKRSKLVGLSALTKVSKSNMSGC